MRPYHHHSTTTTRRLLGHIVAQPSRFYIKVRRPAASISVTVLGAIADDDGSLTPQKLPRATQNEGKIHIMIRLACSACGQQHTFLIDPLSLLLLAQMILMLAVAVTAATAAAAAGQQSANLLHFSRISATSPITKSPWYVAPADVEPRFTRAASNPPPTQPYSSYPSYHHHHQPQQQKQQQYQYNHDIGHVQGVTSEVDAYFANAQRQHDKRNDALRRETQRDHDKAAGDYATVPSVLEPDGDDTPNARVYDQRFHDNEYARVRQAAKQQEKAIVKSNPKHCRTEYKNDMECIVCKNPKSGSHSQQCSFSSTAPKKKYAYTKERNFQSPSTKQQQSNNDDADDGADDETGDNDDDGDDNDDTSEEEETPTTPAPPPRHKKGHKKSTGHNRKSSRSGHYADEFRPSLQTSNNNQQRISSSEWQPVPDTVRFRGYAAQSSELHPYVVDLEPFLYGVRASESLDGGKDAARHAKRETAKDEHDGSSYDGFSFERFFARDFPEAKSAGLIRAVKDGADNGPTKGESKEDDDNDDKNNDNNDDDDGPDAAEFVPDYRNQNVERALAAFKTRDWSKCDKSKRDELTCYVCHDENGVRHEECMFESAGDGAGDDDGDDDNAKQASLVGGSRPTSRSHLSYRETKEYHSKKPTGGQQKQKSNHHNNGSGRSERLQAAASSADEGNADDAAAGDHDDDEENNGRPIKKGPRKTHTKQHKVILKRRTVTHRNGNADDDDSDVGEHQAQASTRFVKRMTADVADAGAANNSSITGTANNTTSSSKSAPASPSSASPTTSSSSSSLTTSTHSAATTTVEAYEIHDDDDGDDGDDEAAGAD